MRHARRQIAHGGQLFLAAHLFLQAAHFAFGLALPLTRLAGALGIIQGQQAEQPHQQRHSRQHSHIVAVLAAGDLKGRDIQAQKNDRHGKALGDVAQARREVTVDHEDPLPLHLHDAPLRRRVRGQLAHALFI